MRSLAAKIVGLTFGAAALIAILEHAGGFSQILESAGGSYSTGFAALTGHAGGRKAVAAGYTVPRGRTVRV